MNKTKNILLIDDSEVDNFIAEHVFKLHYSAGKVTKLLSAIDALNYLKKLLKENEAAPDYILLDINMPQMDGFSFIEEFAKLPSDIKRHSRIIILTSSEDKADEEKAMRIPYVHKYLRKPLSDYSIDEILS
jgi:CheY-like chemotaxis protein